MLSAAAFGCVYLATGLSFRSWRFVSVPDVFQLCRDVALAVLIFFALQASLTPSATLSWSSPIAAYCAILTLLGGVRVLYRASLEGKLPLGLDQIRNAKEAPAERENLLVYGATSETDAFLRSLRGTSNPSYHVVGIIEDDKASYDRSIRGVRVLGVSDRLEEIANFLRDSSVPVSTLVIPTNGVPRAKVRALVDAASKAQLRAVRLPDIHAVLSRKEGKIDFEPVVITDLLGREPVALNLSSIDSLIRGKTVLVTGGGGSIGSELCRQLLSHGPAKLVSIDHAEFNLYNIEQELAANDQNRAFRPILASIRDRERIFAIMREVRPQLVFHAAAYKHVPMVEANPVEGILTNVLGTANVADAAAEAGAEAVVMISTDKAVKPYCAMGLSKRVAEIYCQAMDASRAQKGNATRFMVVRFGNVLGSSGSVVPMFERQIRNGGPVTVTDPRMTRYFMTIPEAVSLVLQGSTFAMQRAESAGAIMVLDMGEPIRIVDLARRMISLAGYLPDRDIPISFIGVREGEKLHEELFDENEILETTDVAGIRLARSRIQGLHVMQGLRDYLRSAAATLDPESVMRMLREVIPNKEVASFKVTPPGPVGLNAHHALSLRAARPKRRNVGRKNHKEELLPAYVVRKGDMKKMNRRLARRRHDLPAQNQDPGGSEL
ncbi:polysaccharide biosynthesis protein [Methylocystis sp. JAN1]|uniref:polysaccharide biosynthesis protein n=1 Tax=Methylocystis sp. JAN1 TaxID=3397211 RepID=UPI003FA292EB